MLIEKENKQERAGKVGLDYTSITTTFCCVYNISRKNSTVLALV